MAYLTVRVRDYKRAAIKAIAHRKGISVQRLMNEWVDELIEQEDTAPPRLGRVLNTLRSHERELRAKGIRRLYLFGSVARGEAARNSDIDIMAEFDPEVPVSILTLGSITAHLGELLGHPVDFADRDSFRPEVLAAIEREAVEVFR